MRLFSIILFTLFISLFISCEKEININFNSKEKQIVVQGVIETNKNPYIILTNSIGFFDKIDFNNVQLFKGA